MVKSRRSASRIQSRPNATFALRPKAAVHFSELYERLRTHDVTIAELLADPTDHKAQLREAKTPEARSAAAARISMRRLAGSAQANLDAAFAAITAE